MPFLPERERFRARKGPNYRVQVGNGDQKSRRAAEHEAHLKYEERKRQRFPELYQDSHERRSETQNEQSNGFQLPRCNGYERSAARTARRRSASPESLSNKRQSFVKYVADTRGSSLMSSADRSNTSPSKDEGSFTRAQDSPISIRTPTPPIEGKEDI
jgi:hypothetical protein